MTSKRPSSLDYSAHLHELAVNNWRRALLDRDTERAQTNARALTASHDKFWRLLGGLHLGQACLCGGRPAAALEAFSEAARLYPETHELVSLPSALSAHTYLELGSPDRAIAALLNTALTPETQYWRAIALSRLSETEAAGKIAEAIGDPALSAHVMFELNGDLEHFRKATVPISQDSLESPTPLVPVLFALGVALLERDEHAGATGVFTQIRTATNAVLHWPIPCIRSLKHLGDLSVRNGDLGLARQTYSALVQFWGKGEMDRDAVAVAAQFVKS